MDNIRLIITLVINTRKKTCLLDNVVIVVENILVLGRVNIMTGIQHLMVFVAFGVIIQYENETRDESVK